MRIELPSYLAFGQLVHESIVNLNNLSSANYKLLDKVVFQVKIKKGYASITEHLKDSTVQTEHLTLEKTLKKHFWEYPLNEHTGFKTLMAETSALGNVFFEKVKDLREIYYPGLCFLLFRVPIDEDQSLSQMLYLLKGEALKNYFHDFYETHLILQRINGKEEKLNISILELLVPLAFTYQLVQELIQSEAVSTKKWYQIIIQDSNYGQLLKEQIFQISDQDYSCYRIIYKNK